ncbi:MAG: DSD1 family PLP-dependent enzyme [Cypionkella sp.]|uniref:DSD1 family PLP-dependent enzyme n=1 Tax=Cypionkella sp. TaxID=2811411 RepID=UPI002AB9B457|nr:DSD1 family PLP-dependent enzyme [Cypionkella sp.]MDZ4310295.1 DSD1 family PLP-dependent enzyme [Cypionkella sp.]
MDFSGLEVGYDIPALPGMAEAAVQTPCLLLDLDALERNIVRMGNAARALGVRHRVHGKMHKSVDVALLQARLGGSCGVCCQKVSEAEAFVRGGIMDVLVSNQVTDLAKIDRLARLGLRGARVIVCVDDLSNVADLAAAARRHGVVVECLVEMDVGAGRCGARGDATVVRLAQAIDAAEGLRFSGVQAYQGAMQHLTLFADRKAAIEVALTEVRTAVAALREVGLDCDIIGGAGTGSWPLEGGSEVYNELQCGSYAFMDADYGRVLDQDGRRFDQGVWENALFVLTSVMSHVRSDWAVCDAGLKAVAVDSGLPVVFGHEGVEYLKCSDEHGEISDPGSVLKINDKLRLVPGHCDPTCNLHDWFVGVRGGVVEVVWPISARGKGY